MNKLDKYFTNYTLAQTNTTTIDTIQKTTKNNEQLLKENAKQIDTIVQNYHNTGVFTAVDIVTGISSLSILIVSIASYIRLVQLPLRNVISYLSLNDIKKKAQVEDILREMLGVVDCSRICVGIFHDGTNIGVIHFTKMSIIYEVVNKNISPIKYTVKNIDIDKLEDEIKFSNKDTFQNVTIDSASPKCKEYMDNVGLKKIISRRFESSEGIFGLFECQWIDENPTIDVMNDPYRISQLNALFRSLYTLLNTLRNSKSIFNW